jgi:hypothetical protein
MNGKEEVWEIVEKFRQETLRESSQDLPVDVFTLAEITLRLDVAPFNDLFSKHCIDAAIMLDFSGIYVDAEAYILWERGPVWKQKRLRFSVAHELGHFALHQEIASKLKFNSLEEFRQWTRTNNGQKYSLEQAANEFAGRLLVPLDRLSSFFDGFAARFDKEFPEWHANDGMRRMFSASASDKFGVNADVIEIRLDRESLWPAE